MDLLNQAIQLLITAIRAGWATAEDLYAFLKEEVGRVVGPLLAKILFAGGFVLMLLTWAAITAQDGLPAGNFGTYKIVSALGVLSIFAMGSLIQALSRWRPRTIPYTASFAVLVGATALPGLILLGHAVKTESTWHWIIGGGTLAIALLEAEIYASVLAWIVLKVSQAIETGFVAIGGPAVAVAPGITLDDIRGRLAPVFNLIEEQLWFRRIKGFPLKILLVALTYLTLVSIWVHGRMVTVVAAGYFGTIILGWFAMRTGSAELVEERRKNFYALLFTVGGLAFVVRILDLWQVADTGRSTIRDLIAGRTMLVGNHGGWSILLVFVFAILTLGMISAVEKVDAKKWKILGVGIPALGILYSAMAIRVWNNDWTGWSPFPSVEAKTVAEAVKVSGADGSGTKPTWKDVDGNSVNLTWKTDRKAECKVEIVEIRHATDKKYAHRTYKPPMLLQTLASVGGTTHEFLLDDLVAGVTVVYRIHATSWKDGTPITTISPVYNASIPLSNAAAPKAETSSIPSAKTPPGNGRRLPMDPSKRKLRAMNRALAEL